MPPRTPRPETSLTAASLTMFERSSIMGQFVHGAGVLAATTGLGVAFSSSFE